MVVIHNLSQKNYTYFMSNRNEPAKVKDLPYSLLTKLSNADICKLQERAILPFTTVQISVENDRITFIKVIK